MLRGGFGEVTRCGRSAAFRGWRSRVWAAGSAAITVLSLSLIVVAPASASACIVGAAASPSVFGSTGTEQCYVVPADVTTVHAVAVGGVGGSGGQNVGPFTVPGGAGAFGARLGADLVVAPGETLYIEVGGNGASVTNTGGPGGAGGFNGGGAGTFGGAGGGGGASDVRTIAMSGSPCTAGASIDSRLIVAAGGGGGGAASGTAGSAGGGTSPDGAGLAGDSSGGAPGGSGATGSGAGAAGGSGTPGSANCGGAGQSGGIDFGSGGGGGGGYFGGGGGGFVFGDGGGGGGGGSSFASRFSVENATLAADNTGIPQITLTPLVATLAVNPAAGLTFPGTQPQATLGAPQLLTLTNTGSGPLDISSLTFTGSDAQDFLISSDGCLGQIASGASCAVAVRFAPQAQGQRQATLQIASNDPASPASVPLAGTGGQLPQGPPGVNGTNGKNGEIELVTCTTVTSTVIKRVGHKRIKELIRRQKCTARLVSGTVRFTTTLDQARLSRGRVVYATGSSVGTAAGRTQLLLQALRRLHPGLYTLTLRSRRGRSWTTRRLQVAVT